MDLSLQWMNILKVLTFPVLCAACPATVQAATVTTGNPRLYAFSGLAGPTNCVDGPTGPICILEDNHAEVHLSLAPADTLSGAERLRISYFEDSASDTAWDVREYSPADLSGNSIDDVFVPDIFSGKSQLWTDLQGVLRIESLEGSAAINAVDIVVWADGRFAGAAVPVPVPPALLLFGSGLAGVFTRGRRRTPSAQAVPRGR